ncbi:MAG: hypothetical protein ABIG68_08760 [Acidobacteriota bacterium]
MKLHYITGVFVLIGTCFVVVIVLKAVRLASGESMPLMVDCGITIGIAGVAASVYGAWLAAQAETYASKAAKHSDRMLSQLVEAQMLVESIHDDYRTALIEHLYHPLAEHSALSKVRAVLSTPSYGDPPVEGDDVCYGLAKIVTMLPENSELVLFNPDAHYYHWANVLLAQGLGGETQNTLAPFLARLRATVTACSARLQAGDTAFRTWATHATPMRLTYFEKVSSGVRSGHGYMVLVDTVALNSPLDSFRGRCFGIPRMWHEGLFAAVRSFFDEFKRCPYSLSSGAESALRRDEFEHYMWDILLGRTSRVLFSRGDFAREVRGAHDRAYEAAERPREFVDTLSLCYIRGAHVLRDLLGDPQVGAAQANALRAELLKPLRANLGLSIAQKDSLADELGKLLENNGGLRELAEGDTNGVRCSAKKHVIEQAVAGVKAGGSKEDVWTSALYLLMGSEFGCSQLALKRRGQL